MTDKGVVDYWLSPGRIDYIPETGCWISHATTNPQGYPNVQGGRKAKALLGRLVLAEKIGHPIPNGYVMRHDCDMPACVNPDHLRIGTQRDNMDDMTIRGRRSLGENHGQAKISANDIPAIFWLSYIEEVSAVDIGRNYGVSDSRIRAILDGKNWRQPIQVEHEAGHIA